MEVRPAGLSDLDAIVPLFDAYRQFYGRAPDAQGARGVLRERLEHRQSVILLARSEHGDAIGFTQLYPSFSSTAMARIFVLNDLFVVPDARRHRVGWQLLEAARDHARAVGAVRLTLSTAIDNFGAQALYQANGWIRDDQFHVFQMTLQAPGPNGRSARRES